MPDFAVIAVIDIGSNSIRLQITQSLEKSYRIIQDYKEILRLADSVYEKGYIDEQTLEIFYKNMQVISNLIKNHNATIIRAVGTAVLRDAANAQEVIQAVKDRTGINIEIISGKEEAYYNYVAVLYNFDIKQVNALTIDVGGGSAEIAISEKGELVENFSTLLGCSRLKYQFFKQYPPSQSEIYALRSFVEQNLDDVTGYDIDMIIGTGGTINNIANIYYIRQNKQITTTAKYVPRIFLKNFINTIRRMKIDDIKKIKGVEEKRSDILLSAAIVLENILSFTGVDGFYVFTGGLRTGLLIDTLNKIGVSMPFQSLDSDLKFARLIEIGNKFNFEEQHARCVEAFSQKLFDKLKNELKLSDKYYLLLRASAILHDIGTYIAFSKHNVHSYYLIKNSDLTGFSAKQKQLIAIVSFYHRGGLPKKSHEFYKQLSKKQKQKVKKLAAILRIADGLDRSHRSYIKDIKVNIDSDKIEIIAASKDDTFLEIKASNLKKDLLEKVTKKQVIVL